MTRSDQLQKKFLRALTIAGFDPSGGAGVLADVRTFAAFGLRASAVITSLTFQNTRQVFGAEHQTVEAVRAQVLPLLEDGEFACAKTGMLPTREVVQVLARLFRETALPRPVVDPVMVSSSGQRLMEEDAVRALIDDLLPLARVVTPNIPEAETLTGTTITTEADMRQAARMIRELGAQAVLIKGGHLPLESRASRPHSSLGTRASNPALLSKTNAGGTPAVPAEEAIDVLDDDGKVTVFREQHIVGAELHGSGCILSAAIAAGLGKGMTLMDAVSGAKSFVLEAFQSSESKL